MIVLGRVGEGRRLAEEAHRRAGEDGRKNAGRSGDAVLVHDVPWARSRGARAEWLSARAKRFFASPFGAAPGERIPLFVPMARRSGKSARFRVKPPGDTD